MAVSRNTKLTMKAMEHVDEKTSLRYQHPGTEQIVDIIEAAMHFSE